MLQKNLESFLIEHITEIISCLRLDHYQVSITDNPKKGIKGAGAAIKVNLRYLNADIWISDNIKDLYKNKAYNIILEMMIHEVTHIVTEELAQYADKHVKSTEEKKDIEFYAERVTEHTSRWAARLYKFYRKVNNIDLNTGKRNVSRRKQSRTRKRNKKVEK
jgi:hypothetical protein